MTGLKDFIYQYKDKVSTYIDEAQNYISLFTDMYEQIPELMELEAGEIMQVGDEQFQLFKQYCQQHLSELQLMVPDANDLQPSAIKCSSFIYNSAISTDNFKIVKLDNPEDPGSEQIDVLWSSSVENSTDHIIHFAGWDDTMLSFDDIITNITSSYACQDIINQVLDLLDQGTLNCATLTSMFSSQYDKFSTDAKMLYSNILSAVTVAGPTNLLSTVWQVIKGTFSGWANATSYDGTILFNNNDYSVNTCMMLPWSTIVKGAGAILSAVGNIISPIIGAAMYSISYLGATIVEALEFNEGNEFMFYPDTLRDNDCYAVPISTYIASLNYPDVTLPTELINYLAKYGKAKMVNGLYTVYAWIGDNTPFSSSIPFTSVCFEVYYSMLSGSEYLLSEQFSFINNIENGFILSINDNPYPTTIDRTITIGLNSNLSVSAFKTNMKYGFGDKDSTSSFDPPMGNAGEIQDQDANSRNRTVIKRLLMNTILYLYNLASVCADHPVSETVNGVTHTLFDYTFLETIVRSEGSKFDPYTTEYDYASLKDIYTNPIDLFNVIIAYFLIDCKDVNQQHFTFHYMPAANVRNPWSSDAAVIAALLNNYILPCINDLFKYLIQRPNIVNRHYLGMYFFITGSFPDTSFAYTNTSGFINGSTFDFITIPGISNSANPYCIPPKYTVSLWVRAALATFVVVSVTVAALVAKCKIKKAITYKAYKQSADVKAKAKAFQKNMSRENFNAYYKAQRRYNRWWGKLSGLYYNGMNNWYDSNYDLAGGSLVSSATQWAMDQSAAQDAAITNNVNSKANQTNGKVDSVSAKIDTSDALLLSIRRLIKYEDE